VKVINNNNNNNNNNIQISKVPYAKLQRRQRRSQSGGIKTTVKKKCLYIIIKCFLKVCTELQFKTSPGRLFQMKGAEYEYKRLANSVFVLRIVSSGSVVNRV